MTAVPARTHGYLADSVVAGGVEIAYRYARSRRRTLGVTVREDLSVDVRVPPATPLADIRAFVAARAAWILRARERVAKRPPPPPKPRHLHGEPHRYLGREYRLEIRKGTADSVRVEGGAFLVETRREPTEGSVERILEGWYRRQAERLFAERIAHWHRVMAAEGLAEPSLKVRRMTSRWGSFSTRYRRVTLSLLLVRAPLACVDYVVLHELCHGRYLSHGPRFWKLVGKYMPDYAERRRTLNGYAA